MPSQEVRIASGSYSDSLVFSGEIVGLQQAVPVERLVVALPRHEYPRDMQFSCFLRAGFAAHGGRLLAAAHPLEFRGVWERTNDGHMLENPAARVLLLPTSWKESELGGVAEVVDLDVAPFDQEPVTQEVTAEFTPTDLAFSAADYIVRYPSGQERRLFWPEPRPVFTLAAELGAYDLAAWYSHERASIGTTAAEVLVRSVSMHRTLDPAQRRSNPVEILDAVTEDIKDVETVLSFLGRRHVSCHTIRLWSQLAAGPHVRDSRRHLRGWSSPPPPEALIHAPALPSDALGNILGAFRTSQFKEPITYTASFLVSYWTSGFAENTVSSGFTAFETLINGMGEIRGDAKTIPDDVFVALKERVHQHIKDFSAENGLTKETRASLYAKLPELARAAIAPRAAAILEDYGVEWRDLWPRTPGQRLEQMIGQAYGRRSLFVHAGRVAEWSDLLNDAASVHALAERLICRLLNVEPAWLWHFAYRYATR